MEATGRLVTAGVLVCELVIDVVLFNWLLLQLDMLVSSVELDTPIDWSMSSSADKSLSMRGMEKY